MKEQNWSYKPSRFMLPTSHYDKQKADMAVLFVEQLKHTKGIWAGKPFLLLPWEEQIIRDLFGIVKQDGTRQFHEAYIECGKKSGKSELAAAIALLLLYLDNEPSAEIYGAAGDRNQASLVFDVALQFVVNCPALMKRSKVSKASKQISTKLTMAFTELSVPKSAQKPVSMPAALFLTRYSISPMNGFIRF